MKQTTQTDRHAAVRANGGEVIYINGVPVIIRGEWHGMARQCAWCSAVAYAGQFVQGVKPVSAKVSHGMCPDCRDVNMRELAN